MFPDSIEIGAYEIDNEHSHGGIVLSIAELEAIVWWMKNKGKKCTQ